MYIMKRQFTRYQSYGSGPVLPRGPMAFLPRTPSPSRIKYWPPKERTKSKKYTAEDVRQSLRLAELMADTGKIQGFEVLLRAACNHAASAGVAIDEDHVAEIRTTGYTNRVHYGTNAAKKAADNGDSTLFSRNAYEVHLAVRRLREMGALEIEVQEEAQQLKGHEETLNAILADS